MTEQEKRYAADILDAIPVKAQAEKFRQWLHMTMYYAAIGQGIPPSHAAIEDEIEALRLDTFDGPAQARHALSLLRKSGLNIDAVHQELGR